MRSAIVTIFIFAAAVFLAGCRNTAPGNSANTTPANIPVSSSTLKAELSTDPIFVDAGKDVEIILTLKDDKDQAANGLPYTKEAPLHVTAVAQDLSEMYDLALQLESDGTFRVHHTFPTGGRYTFFVDLMTPDGRVTTQTIGFGVAGTERPKQVLKVDDRLNKTVGDLRVELELDVELAAGKPVQLNSVITDKANKPSTGVKTIKFIVVSEDAKEFVRTQTASENDSARVVTFPKGGLYKIWLQIGLDGKTMSVPFVVKVKPAEGEVDYSKIEVPKGAVRVTVGKEGFTPKAIEAKAGKPLTLAFIRIDQENCGTEVTFPSLNLRKDLPLGKVVTVEIPAEHAGEFNFSCGMEMLKGVVMVE